ncbi:ribonuclease D [Hirschia litorea]|uniref:Ribonuclease D n=1 Tax=Hirschia litorea TaxID=1199156 RepID=A0ABW2II46_9PROT
MPSNTRDELKLVADTDELIKACEELKKGEFIAVDTEFHRESTFWPKLCLIQAATLEFDCLIDPLSPNIDLTPFLELMADTSRVKVFHAARQDMEIFTKLIGTPPAPIFDSQIAAMACGLGDSVSYENLVSQLLKAKIDKSSQFTDWVRRPLTEKQLNYARGDVTHLRHAYVILKAKLEKLDRMKWIEEETSILVDPNTYDTNPKNAWKRMKIRKPRKDYLALIAAVSEWRETVAQDMDKPRSRVLKDDAVQEIAQQKPADENAMERLRAVPKGFVKSRHGQALMETIQAALQNPDAYAPEIPRRPTSTQPPGAVGDLLKVLLKHVSEEAEVAPRLIANAADIERIACDDEPDVPAMRGWRREVFGDLAMKLKDGKIAIAISKTGVKVFDV